MGQATTRKEGICRVVVFRPVAQLVEHLHYCRRLVVQVHPGLRRERIPDLPLQIIHLLVGPKLIGTATVY